MSLFELLMLLVAVAGALRILSQKWGVAHPSLLVLGGLAVALRDLLLVYDEEAGSDSHEHLASGDDFTAAREEEASESPG